MSAKMIIPQAEADQGFGLLKDIVEMVKNPKAIDEAYERRKQAAQLTDDEVAKAESARALIAQSDALRTEIQGHYDAIGKAQQDLTTNVDTYSQHVESENTRLSEWEARLQVIADTQAAVAATQKDSSAALDKRSKDIEDAHAKWGVDCKTREDAISATSLLQKSEDDRLATWAKKLKDKAARLAAEAQSDG